MTEPITPSSHAIDDELTYEDLPIYITWYENDTALRAGLAEARIKHPNDTIAYCDTYGDEDTSAWGRIYLVKNAGLDSVVHESIHMATGIMAQKGKKSLDFTTAHATSDEEELCGIVGGISGLLLDKLIAQAVTAKLREVRGKLPNREAKIPGDKTLPQNYGYLQGHAYAIDQVIALLDSEIDKGQV